MFKVPGKRHFIDASLRVIPPRKSIVSTSASEKEIPYKESNLFVQIPSMICGFSNESRLVFPIISEKVSPKCSKDGEIFINISLIQFLCTIIVLSLSSTFLFYGSNISTILNGYFLVFLIIRVHLSAALFR